VQYDREKALRELKIFAAAEPVKMFLCGLIFIFVFWFFLSILLPVVFISIVALFCGIAVFLLMSYGAWYVVKNLLGKQ